MASTAFRSFSVSLMIPSSCSAGQRNPAVHLPRYWR
jgi:hypothetical protein